LFYVTLDIFSEGSGVQGRVLQRFPKEDWEGFEFPEDGIVKVSSPQLSYTSK